jgi:hypothetical protein
VSVRKDKGVAVEGPDTGDDPVDPGRHLVGRLAALRTFSPYRPARPLEADLRRREALVLTVVPLEQVVGRFDAVGEAGEVGGIQRARPGTGEHQREVVAGQLPGDAPGLRAARLRQRDVGPPGVLAEPGPLGLAVPYQPELGLGLIHPASLPLGVAALGDRRVPRAGERRCGYFTYSSGVDGIAKSSGSRTPVAWFGQ